DGDGAGEELLATLFAEGQPLYAQHCAVCHGADGRGVIGPPLVDSGMVAAEGGAIEMILWGFEDHGMPAFGGLLNDRQIAAIATYVRNAWTNDFGIATPEEVAQAR